MSQRYIIALGSNVRHPRHGLPPAVLRAALAAMADEGLKIDAASPIIASAPLGPSRRRYANGVVRIATSLGPPALLALLKQIETRFGRLRPYRNAPRTLDLDLLLHGTTVLVTPDLVLPHPRLHERAFVLRPMAEIDPDTVVPGHGAVRQCLPAVAAQRCVPWS